MNLSAIYKLRSLSLVKQLIVGFLIGSKIGKILIYPKVHVTVLSGSSFEGTGRLWLGCRWNYGIFKPSQIKLLQKSMLKVKGVFKVYTGFSIVVKEGAILELGSGYISDNSTIHCYKSITIGNNVAISSGVTIRDSDDHSINDNINITSPIIICDNVWIGINATILKGVTINKGCVIAAGAVVTRDVPENSLAGGVPARIIKNNIYWK